MSLFLPKQGRSKCRVDFEFFPAVAGSAERDEVGKGVALGVAIRNDMVNIDAILAAAQDASLAIPGERLLADELPFLVVGGCRAASPEMAPLATVGLRPSLRAASGAAARLVVADSREERRLADDAIPGRDVSFSPPAFGIARAGAVSPRPAGWRVEQAAAHKAIGRLPLRLPPPALRAAGGKARGRAIQLVPHLAAGRLRNACAARQAFASVGVHDCIVRNEPAYCDIIRRRLAQHEPLFAAGGT
jgi:hypothetical protein